MFKDFITMHWILFDIDAKRPDISFKWEKEKVRLRNRLFSIEDDFLSLSNVCSIYIDEEFKSRFTAYLNEEKEMDKIFNDPIDLAFGVDSGALTKILKHLEILVVYLRQLTWQYITDIIWPRVLIFGMHANVYEPYRKLWFNLQKIRWQLSVLLLQIKSWLNDIYVVWRQ